MPTTFLPTALFYQPVVFATWHFSNPFSPPRRLPTSQFCQLATLSIAYFSQPDISAKRSLFNTQILLPLDSFSITWFCPPCTHRLLISHFCKLATYVNCIFPPTGHFLPPRNFCHWVLFSITYFCPTDMFANQSLLSTGYFCQTYTFAIGRNVQLT